MISEEEVRRFVLRLEASLLDALRNGADVSLECHSGTTDVDVGGMVVDAEYTGELLFKVYIPPARGPAKLKE